MLPETTAFEQPSAVGMVPQLTEEELLQAEAEAMEEERMKREESLNLLATSIEARFRDRASRRTNKEREWLESLRMYYGKLAINSGYERNADRPFGEPGGQTRPDVNIVRSKCDIAVAQCASRQFAGGEKNWDLRAAVNSPEADATTRALAMSRTIEMQLEKTRYGQKSREAMFDRTVIGTGILKGPVNTGKLTTSYEPVQLPDGTTTWLPKAAVENDPCTERVSPWFFYPDDSVPDFGKADDAIEVHPMGAHELSSYMKHPGFMAEGIQQVLRRPPVAFANDNFSQYASVTDTNPHLFRDKYIVLEYHGPITIDQMQQLGIEPVYESPSEKYYGEIWCCQGTVIRAQIETIEAAFELPYMVSVWVRDPSSIFGFGAPQMMKDQQRVVTAAWRMILDNASASSGPQIAMHRGYIEPADKEWTIAPNKVWYLTDQMMDINKAIQFFNVPNVTGMLMPILQAAQKFAEEESETPMIAGGLQGGQLADTATGGLMLRESATTLLDYLSEEWDANVTEKLVRRYWAWNMQYNPDNGIKGNFSIDVRTSTEYKNNQMHLRDLERLSMEASQNPSVGMLVNMDEIVRARLAMMKLPSGRIVRSEEEVAQIKEAQANQPNPQMMDMQLKQQELALRERELALKESQLQFELQQQQQREIWEHEEKMAANMARMAEAQATVTKSQNEKETQLLMFAGKMEDQAEGRRLQESIAVRNDETKRFSEVMRASQQKEKLMAHEAELNFKATTGRDGI